MVVYLPLLPQVPDWFSVVFYNVMEAHYEDHLRKQGLPLPWRHVVIDDHLE